MDDKNTETRTADSAGTADMRKRHKSYAWFQVICDANMQKGGSVGNRTSANIGSQTVTCSAASVKEVNLMQHIRQQPCSAAYHMLNDSA